MLDFSVFEEIAERFGTPVYVYEERKILGALWKLKKNIQEIMKNYFHLSIFYALKANSNPEILKILLQNGVIGIDAVSPGEINLVLGTGFEPDIIFTANNATDEEIDFAVKKKVQLNVDSLSRLEKVGKKYPSSEIWLRINANIGAGHHSYCITGGPESKFGIWHTETREAKQIAKRYGLEIVGLHQHIGSQILEVKIFLKAMDALLEIAKHFPKLNFLDFGGGLGVPYRPEETSLDIQKLGKGILERYKNFRQSYGREVWFILEPGRYLVAEAGYLLVRVNTIKKNPNGRIFAGVDSGSNHLIRPMMYNAYHEVINSSNPNGKKEKVDVVGNICESGDKFATQREINHIREDDLLVIKNAGAYGFSMSSNYNGRPKPAEVLVEANGNLRLIRPRETLDDLI